MAPSVELMILERTSEKAGAMLHALHAAIWQAGSTVTVTTFYRGDSDWLILYGVGAPDRDKARKLHVKSGRRVLLWDLAYFERLRYLRCSIDHDHPQAFLDSTSPDPSRWDELKIKLREDYDPKGHVVLVGLGAKSRSYLHEQEWESVRLAELRRRFPGRPIVYKPKPGSPILKLACEMADQHARIEDVLHGAALVVCRHSNVACDAAVAGVPYECIDGAAMWLAAKAYTRENRLDFLRRVAWWQWRHDEAGRAWKFIQDVSSERMAA